MNVIAIDGPAGSGKSTTARAVAERLGFAHLESGALYRAMTLAALDHAVPLDGQRIVALARSLPVRLSLAGSRFRPEVAGADVSQAVRRSDVTAAVSTVSALPEVRVLANELQRHAAALHARGTVIDGRDIGTVVFPDAQLKVYLTATAAARAARRLEQEGRAADANGVREEAERLVARDRADSERTVAPLAPAPDAVHLDTTELSFTDQVDQIVALARKVFI